MSKIAICLWFDNEGEVAAHFYVDLFRRMGRQAAVRSVARYGPGAPKPEGEVMTVTFTLGEVDFMALNGGPQYPPSPATSLMIHCADQAELDGFWDGLLDGGQAVQCGWLTDRFGVSWQVVPADLERLVGGEAATSGRVMKALMGMIKLDIAALERAAAS